MNVWFNSLERREEKSFTNYAIDDIPAFFTLGTVYDM